jgi:SAM-dependent methyltransferase
MGTGGGEFLASLHPLPPDTWATEAYPPNIPIARARLTPLGVHVLDVERDDHLPLPSSCFDTIINRHAAFRASEVARLLQPGGRFLTQQVGERNNGELNRWLQKEEPAGPAGQEEASWRQKAVDYLVQAGLEVIVEREEYPLAAFGDIGAIVYYLKAVPWQVRGFTVETHYAQLRALHEQIQTAGSFPVTSHRCYIEAVKPLP